MRNPARRWSRAALALALAAGAALPAAGAEVRHFRLDSRKSFLPGTFDGVSIDPLGTLGLADRVERLRDIDEPFLFAAAPHPDGWVLGTGNDGRVLLLGAEGKLETLFAAPEPEIFAVWVDPDGAVFAGSSPGGKVYRIAGGEAAVFFDPQDTYIWSLARDGGGSLLVATGTEGRLYAVDPDGQGRVVYDSDDTHLRALKPLPGGDLLVGTAGEGLILRMAPGGEVRTLFDAEQPEVVAFAAAPDGTCYAALLASEATLMDLARPRPPTRRRQGEEAEGEEEGEPEPQVAVVLAEEEAVGAMAAGRPPSYRGPRSEILKISPAGIVESVWNFQEETVYSLLWHRDRLWVGTGLEGKLYSLEGDRMVLEQDVDERQVVALLPDRPGPAFATTNAAAFYRMTSRTELRGTYTSPALDAGQLARFGSFRWEGDLPRGTAVEVSFRSGVSAEPDATWSPWTPGRQGRELPVSGVPRGRYLQWRAELRAADGRSPTLSAVQISYRQENLPPKIASLAAMDPGQILVPANFNPASQVFEPAHPDRQGIFTPLEPAAEREDRRLKTLWKKGYRTLRWEAEDPNGDELVFALEFRPEVSEAAWLPVQENLEDGYYSFDATVLPDGRYRFRLRASDRRGNPPEEVLEAMEVSAPVVVDHTPPVRRSVARRGGALEVMVEDALSPIREAVFSADAEKWEPARPADGLLDGLRETLRIEPPEGAGLLLLRVTDAAFNAVTYDLSGELP